MLHPLLPLLLLAGVGVQAIWETRRRWYGKLGAVAVVLGFAYAGYASYLVNAVHRADPRELLVSTQSSEEVKRVADEVVARAERQPTTITVDSSEGATFPWAWYFRDLPVGYVELGAGSTAPAPDSDVLILTQRRARPPRPAAARATRRASSRSASGGCATTTRCRRRVVALVHRPRAVEPDGRHARVALPAPLISEAPDRRAVALEDHARRARPTCSSPASP